LNVEVLFNVTEEILFTRGDPSVVNPSQARVSLLRDDTFFFGYGGEEAAGRPTASIINDTLLRPAASSPLS
jgi:hypothetical protein